MSFEQEQGRDQTTAGSLQLELEPVRPGSSTWRFMTARIVVVALVLVCMAAALRGRRRPDASAVLVTTADGIVPHDAAPSTTPGHDSQPAQRGLAALPVTAWSGDPAGDEKGMADDGDTAPDGPARTTPDDGATPDDGTADDAVADATPEPDVDADDAVLAASTPGAEPREKFEVSTWRDFHAQLDGLSHAWGSGSGTVSFDIVLINESAIDRSMHVAVFARNDIMVPPRREVWPAAILGEDFVGPTGSLLSGTLSRTWGTRSGDARGATVTLGAGGTTSLHASLPLRATSPYNSWKDQPLEPLGFVEYLLWVFDDNGRLVYTKRYECLPPARR